mmetsp:Transcript_26001/g.82117  ORF Transcript_26001/g.82117 Transcript_26001/m.82117 type:complete len:710 (+) Transcript_26001:91-2220(+)
MDATTAVAQTALAWLAYNRDAYADNVAMRQNQIYQKKNYHISWVSCARDDIRDIMQTSVGRINNLMIVTTLILGIVAAAILEGSLPGSVQHFIVHTYYASLATSVLYLMLSITFGVEASNTAFDYSIALLTTAVMPDTTDDYDFDYMKQTQQFEKSIRPFRIPLLMPLRARLLKGQDPRLEMLSWRPAEDGEQGKVPDRPAPKDQAAWYFECFRHYAMLWAPMENGAQECMGYGTVMLFTGGAYYWLGTLHEHHEMWSAFTLCGLFIFAGVFMFYKLFLSEKAKSPVDNSRTLEFRSGLGQAWGYSMMLLLVFAPMVCGVAMRWPMDWVAHASARLSMAGHAAFALLCCVREKDMDVATKHEEEEPDPSHEVEPEGSPAGASPLSSASRRVAAKVGLGPKARKYLPTVPADVDFEAGRDATAGNAYCDEQNLEKKVNDQKEHMLRTFRKVKGIKLTAHGACFVTWFSLAAELTGSQPFPEQAVQRAAVADVAMAWPSPHVSPRALACAGGRAFAADEFRVFELAGGRAVPLPCDLSHTIADVAAACDGPRCWPLVLTDEVPAQVVNCSGGPPLPFLQTPGTVRAVAARSGGRAATFAAVGGRLLEYQLPAAGGGLQPLWPLMDLDTEGLQSMDASTERLLLFRSSAGGTSTVESYELAAPVRRSGGWRLPGELPPLVAGCAEAGTTTPSSLLLLLRDAASGPRLVRMAP